MAKGKKKTPNLNNPAYIKNPTTKNQRAWNREIARLERYEKRHKGIKISYPTKPKRITKKDLHEISQIKGRKILERSTVAIKLNKKTHYISAKNFYDLVAKGKTAKEREKEFQKGLKNPPEFYEPNEPTDQEDDLPSYADAVIEQWWQEIYRFPKAGEQFREMMKAWEQEMLDEFGKERFAQFLDEMNQSGHPMSVDVAYKAAYRTMYLTHFANLIHDETVRAYFIDYINQLNLDYVGETTEAILEQGFYGRY